MVDGVDLARLLGIAAGAFLADVAVFATMRRLRPGGRRVRAHAAGLLAALLTVIGAYLLAPGSRSILLPVALALAVCNAYILFHLDNMGETARRIRILRELHDAPQGLERKEILRLYPPREVFERRIARLTLAGQCRSRDGRLVSGGASYSAMQRVVDLLARLVFGSRRVRK